MALKRGDDTASLQGRVTLNPLAHIELFGTVILPLLGLFIGGFLIGWGKPVRVNPANLKHRKMDDILITMAGPFMNILAALAAMVAGRVFLLLGLGTPAEFCVELASLSMFL